MPIVLLDTRKPGLNRPKVGRLAAITAKKIQVGLDPMGRGFLVLPDGEAPTLIYWDGTLEALFDAGGVVDPKDAPHYTEAFKVPSPTPRGIIEIDDEPEPEPAAPPLQTVSPAEAPLVDPLRSLISMEKFPIDDTSWFDITLLDGQVLMINKVVRVYSASPELKAQDIEKPGFINRIIGAVMAKFGGKNA